VISYTCELSVDNVVGGKVSSSMISAVYIFI